MDDFKSVLGNIVGGKVLDVATLEGRFTQILMENLKDYTEIIGIDIHEKAIENANGNMGQEDIRFMVMDAMDMDFGDETFDTVCISASLHHLSDIPKVLAEMKRVLKPGGHFIVAEMHCQAHSEAELTSTYLHRWAADVDSRLGQLHKSTLTRQEIVNCVEAIGLGKCEFHDFVDTDSDAMEISRLELMESAIDRYLQRVEQTDWYDEFSARGDELRRRIHEVGAQGEPVLIAIGEK